MLRHHFIISIIISIFFSFASLAQGDEIKLGLVESPQEHEYKVGVNFEYIFSEKYTKFEFRPHIGVNINTFGYTSALYTGIVFDKIFENKTFIEASLGFAIHNGKLKRSDQKRGRTLGSRLLFRESLSLGYYLSKNKSVSIFIDHISNANLAPPNHGITNIGLRFGYQF